MPENTQPFEKINEGASARIFKRVFAVVFLSSLAVIIAALLWFGSADLVGYFRSSRLGRDTNFRMLRVLVGCLFAASWLGYVFFSLVKNRFSGFSVWTQIHDWTLDGDDLFGSVFVKILLVVVTIFLGLAIAAAGVCRCLR